MSEDLETPDVSALLLSLSGPSGQYTAMDRYRDYRKVFLASDDGQRVLRDILAHCHTFKTSFDKDPGTMAFREGERNVAQFLMFTISNEPKQRPTRANSAPTKENSDG